MAPDESVDNKVKSSNSFASFTKLIFDWGVLLVMLVLPGLVSSYAIVFTIAFGLGLLFLSVNAYKYSTGQVKIFPKVFEVGIVLLNCGLMSYEYIAEPSRDWSRNWTSVIINGTGSLLNQYQEALHAAVRHGKGSRTVLGHQSVRAYQHCHLLGVGAAVHTSVALLALARVCVQW